MPDPVDPEELGRAKERAEPTVALRGAEDEAREAGMLTERERVLTWLRQQGDSFGAPFYLYARAFQVAAQCIERLDHHKDAR